MCNGYAFVWVSSAAIRIKVKSRHIIIEMLSLKRMHKWISQSQSPHSVNQWGKKRRKNRIKLVVSKHLIQEVIHYMINSLIVYVAVHSVSEIVRKHLIFRLVSFQHFDFIDILCLFDGFLWIFRLYLEQFLYPERSWDWMLNCLMPDIAWNAARNKK